MVLSKHPASGLTSFIILVFHHAAVVFLLTQCCEGQILVVGPLQSLTVMIGNDIILPCHLEPASDASGLTFEWSRPDLKPRFVHVWHERQDLHVNQHSFFKGRTSVDIAKLKHGDISLKLIKVKHTDTGKYRCYFPDLDIETTVQLVVGSASLPVLSLAGIDRSTSGVVLQCESAGWYPEPELLWLDDEGSLLSAGPTETLRGPDDLYTVSSRVTVEKRHSNNITCRVQQRNINQSREIHIHVPDFFFGSPCSSTACIAVSLAACVMSIFILTFAAWKGSRNKLKATMIPHQENLDLMAESEKIKDIENKMIKLEEELQRKEKENKIMVGILMQQKEELEKQKDQLQLQHKKMEKLVDDNEEEFKSVEKEIKEKAQDKKITSSSLLQLTPIISKYKWGLTDGVNTFDELILSTERLIEEMSNIDLH